MLSDLMIEAVNIKEEGCIKKTVRNKNNKITTLTINNDKYIKGEYITIEFKDIFNNTLSKDLVNAIKYLFKKNNINELSSALIVGLGNEKSTPDSLGPLVIDNIIVTRHLEILGLNSNRVVSAIKPGVTGSTGIETKDIIKSVVDKIKPDFIIVIDSLKSKSLKRLNKTIQLTDTGIHPGSGVQNKREKISEEVLGIPVIAIGVPTVCDIKTITNEKINVNDNMIITSKDIDFVIEKMSDLISISINKSLYEFN